MGKLENQAVDNTIIGIANALPSFMKAKPTAEEERKKRCIAAGGTWDGVKCIMPEAEKPKIIDTTPTPTKPNGEAITSRNTSPEEYEKFKLSQGFPPTDTSQFSALRNAETGRLSGFEHGGKTYLGANPQDTRGALEAEANKQELLVGGQASTILENRQQQQAGLSAAAEVFQTPLDPLEEVEQIKLNYWRAALSAIPGIIPDAIGLGSTFAGGAFVGGQLGPQAATPEEVVTVPTAALIGAGIGAIKGFYKSYISDLSKQRGEAIEAPIRTLTETKPLLSNIINAQLANPEDREKHKQQWDIQTQKIRDDYDNLKDLTDSQLTALLGENGINQLKEYKVYFTGEAQQLEYEFADALANPDPTKIRATSEDIAKMKQLIEQGLK